jgi:MFS family permease
LKPLSALRYPAFARFLCGRSITVLAVQMQSVAVGWQVYAITGNPLDLGLIGLAQFLPFVILILPAGQIADRHHRQKILTLCYVTEVVCAILLLAFTLSDMSSVWPVFSVMVLFGVARAFSMPSSQALIPNLVPIESFGNAVALNSSSFQVATILGPTIGGVLYIAGPQVVYATVAVLISISVVMMWGVKPLRGPAPRGTSGGWHEVLEGLRFVKSRPIVLGAISLDLFAVLFGGAVAMLPAYAHDVLHAGPTGLGLLRSAPGIGAALVALILAFAPIQRHAGRWMFGGVALFGASTVVFGV